MLQGEGPGGFLLYCGSPHSEFFMTHTTLAQMAQGLPDILAPGLQVVFCGLNPGADAAVAGHHFLGRGNRY